ncbi:hypothetical protein OIU85_002063 [Salix viminalis]|uniref:LOB domain-containing protein n=1 Tax=Salix viminalis TaxID=40686 RepID=A0A9Q0VML1_SALVM|nr:hypothetical protein OIU85_002063 [Salix viminalis]
MHDHHKLLNEVHPHQREDAVNSLAYEAEARMKDPVYGCVGAISVLQRQVIRLQKELDATNADLIRYACNEMPAANPQFARRMGQGGVSYDQSSGIYYPSPWNHDEPCGERGDGGV